MRKLIYGINLTSDGGCDHTMCNPDDEVLDYFAGLTSDAGVLLYGRKTYELMVPYWPLVAKNPAAQSRSNVQFAEAYVAVPQITVFSRTLKKPEAINTTVLHSDLQLEIQKMKDEPGKSILVGGVDLPSQLLQLGLIDEVHVVIHPIIAGKGRRLFDELKLPEKINLKLEESKPFISGCVALRYSLGAA